MVRQAKAQRMLTHEQIWGALDRLAARAGLSPSGLAKRAGLDPTTFNKSKRVTSDGRERWPSTESLAKALAAAGSSIETFVRLIGDGARDGFIHFSTATQVPGTLRKHYFGQRALFLVEVDGDALGDALRWERSRNDELFPHLYGELDLGAVIAVMNLNMRSDGNHDIPELAP